MQKRKHQPKSSTLIIGLGLLALGMIILALISNNDSQSVSGGVIGGSTNHSCQIVDPDDCKIKENGHSVNANDAATKALNQCTTSLAFCKQGKEVPEELANRKSHCNERFCVYDVEKKSEKCTLEPDCGRATKNPDGSEYEYTLCYYPLVIDPDTGAPQVSITEGTCKQSNSSQGLNPVGEYVCIANGFFDFYNYTCNPKSSESASSGGVK